MADTVAALATAPVKGAIGVLRISGDEACGIARCVFKSRRSLDEHPREMIYGDFVSGSGEVLDRGLAVFYRAPQSYTGEDVVEFFCHGSLTVLGEILNCLYRAGARPAKPGEYTRRAFLNGRMDLTQAEAVIDLIDAESVQAAKNAAAQLEGAMGSAINSVRAPLVDMAAEFYAYVDYPDEEIEQSGLEECLKVLGDAEQRLSKLAESYERGRLLRDGVSCAIIGKPNVGKSSVLNALLGYERSIVTDIAGTTRDTVEEILSLGGLRLRLIDTAGIRDTEDPVEQLGVCRARRACEDAELVIAVFDSSCELTDEDRGVLQSAAGKTAVAVVNKDDLEENADIREIKEVFGERICRVSAHEVRGFEQLENMLQEIFAVDSIPCAGETVTNPRHAAALRSAADHVRSAREALASGLTPDVAVGGIEAALSSMEELTGQTASDQVVARIFERFCVGK